jgi:hypothetical protein
LKTDARRRRKKKKGKKVAEQVADLEMCAFEITGV